MVILHILHVFLSRGIHANERIVANNEVGNLLEMVHEILWNIYFTEHSVRFEAIIMAKYL